MTQTFLFSVTVRGDVIQAFLGGHIMAGLREAGVDCTEIEGQCDLKPENARLVEERNAAISESHQLRCRLEAIRRLVLEE